LISILKMYLSLAWTNTQLVTLWKLIEFDVKLSEEGRAIIVIQSHPMKPFYFFPFISFYTLSLPYGSVRYHWMAQTIFIQ
jgi:hypothetical protein